jgi:hypothetical protein
VAQDDVVTYISTASAGVHPLVHVLDGQPLVNHEVALATKFFDYAHAGLPVVVSDVRTMAEAVRATGVGEVFVAEDADDLARAVRAVLADPERYRKAYEAEGLLDGWSWEAQAAKLTALYDRVTAGMTTSRTPAAKGKDVRTPAHVEPGVATLEPAAPGAQPAPDGTAADPAQAGAPEGAPTNGVVPVPSRAEV